MSEYEDEASFVAETEAARMLPVPGTFEHAWAEYTHELCTGEELPIGGEPGQPVEGCICDFCWRDNAEVDADGSTTDGSVRGEQLESCGSKREPERGIHSE